MAILGAETDNLAPPELLKQLGDILSAKGEVYLSKKKLIVWKRKKMNWIVVFFFLQVDSFVKIFPGVGHGWTMRYDEDDEFAVRSAQESHLDMLNWLTKYIK